MWKNAFSLLLGVALLGTLSVLVGIVQGTDDCGPANCYPCYVDTPPKYDFVFIVDMSGSMQDEIQNVADGATDFAQNLVDNGVDANFGIAIFSCSSDPSRKLDITTFSNFKSTMSRLPNEVGGGLEPGLESIRGTLQDTSKRNLDFTFRTGAKVVIFLMTDEDSDPCASSKDCPWYSGIPTYGCIDITPSYGPLFQDEIDCTADDIEDWFNEGKFFGLYLLVNSDDTEDRQSTRYAQDCNTFYQYGNPSTAFQVYDPDYTNFDMDATLANNLANSKTQGCLQTRLLQKGILARVFDVSLLGTSTTFVKNLFQAIANDVASCDSCQEYTCDANNLCLAPTYICDCTGTPYGTATTDCAGVCQGTSVYDCNNVCGGNGALDHCGTCTANGVDAPGCYQDCDGVYYKTPSSPAHLENECDVCYLATDTAPYCCQDCTGNWRTSADQLYFEDPCQGCVPPGTPSVMDQCNVCNGGNKEMNECGQCYGITGDDLCGNPKCEGLNCQLQCDGKYVETIVKHTDECGNCVSNDELRDPNCTTDCAGNYYMKPANPLKADDPCGNCVAYGTIAATCVKDCAGVWGGSSYYDKCGQCVDPAGTTPFCGQDCRPEWVGASGIFYTVDECGDCVAPGTQPDQDSCGVCHGDDSEKNHCGECFGIQGKDNCGNYLCNNTDCFTDCRGENVTEITYKINQCGECVDTPDPQCMPDCKGNYYLNGTDTPLYWVDHCGKCVAYGTQSCSQDCNGVWGGTAYRNDCGDCVAVGSGAYCQKDCNNQWHDDPSAMWSIDRCGDCVAPGTAPDVDDCNVCHGNNSEKDPCGVCNGVFGTDNCGNNKCANMNCAQDCDNDWVVTIEKHVDHCGQCVSNDVVDGANCLQGCNGVYYLQGTANFSSFDYCGKCVRNGTISAGCVQDCSHTWGGSAYYDHCGRCVTSDDGLCVQDCDNTYYVSTGPAPHVYDPCGPCVASADVGEFYDDCQQCTNFPGYDSSNCALDCGGVYRWKGIGASVYDDCGVCIAANNKSFYDYLLDDCGVCRSSQNDPLWDSDRAVDTQGKLCACFAPPLNCTDANGKSFTFCGGDGCPATCSGTTDSCGRCSTDPAYGLVDKCGVCCSTPGCENSSPDMDYCGICFGFNQTLLHSVCHTCNSSDHSCVDCLGVPFGTAKLDCAGKCNGNSVCSTAQCGNGIVEEGEECDLGAHNSAANGCDPVTCQVVTHASNLQTKLGIGLGTAAAVILLVIAGFAAYQYAIKTGLLGSAVNKVDFGAQMENPLYEEVGGVVDNPLYDGEAATA